MTRRSRNRAAQPDPIAAQYNQWVYPRPLDDLAAQPGRQAADPALTHRIYWPDRADPGPLDILVAGCGANQAAEIAFHNRSARVVGIDVSDAALAHERVLKDKHQLANLETLKLPVEAAARLGHQFDLVIATGVLHHLVDPVAGLKALGDCLKRDGAVVVMLYATYGRFPINLLRTLFETLGLQQDAAALAIIKETLRTLSPAHPAHQILLADDRDIKFDAGLIDLFLNAREHSYTARECLELVEAAGLTFQRWFQNRPFAPQAWFRSKDSALYRAITALDDASMWSAMECITKPLDGRHMFVACRRDRPRASYAIDFDDPAALDYVPCFAPGVQTTRLDDGAPDQAVVVIERLRASARLDANQVAFLKRVDATCSIREIADLVTPSDARASLPLVHTMARDLFEYLWALDLIEVRLNPPPIPT